MMICILERENMCTNANKSLHQVRLSLTAGDKKHLCLHWPLCLHDSPSNSSCKSGGKLPSVEGGEAKIHSTSPRRKMEV
jgi:hypothetical protein